MAIVAIYKLRLLQTRSNEKIFRIYIKKKKEKNGLSNIKKKSKPKLSPTYSDIM